MNGVIRVKVSKKNQISLPSEARRKLGIQPGDTLMVHLIGDHLVVMPEPKDWASALMGFQYEIWKDIDALVYVREMRGGDREAE
jgi:AbrB family looped-hinge helix DNA binding protein